ncbi:MAG: hypothetical protein AAF790_12365 [Planctomycetota bacterium]
MQIDTRVAARSWPRRPLHTGAGGLVFLAVLAAGLPPAHAIGPWNVPSNWRQFCGAGNGPGFHAPMIQADPCFSGSEAKPVFFTPYPPRPSAYGGGFCGSMSTLHSLPPAAYAAAGHPAAAYPHGVHDPSVGHGVTPQPVHAPVYAPPQPVYRPAPPARVAPSPAAAPAPQPPAEPASPSDVPAPEVLPLPSV